MSPELAAMQINIVSPHSLTSRPLIIPIQSVVNVRVILKRWQSTMDDIILRADGQIIGSYQETSDFSFTQHSETARLWHRSDWNYYSVLSQKMLWWQHGK